MSWTASRSRLASIRALRPKSPDEAVSLPYSCSYTYLINVSDKGPEVLKEEEYPPRAGTGFDRDVIVNWCCRAAEAGLQLDPAGPSKRLEMPEIATASMTQADLHRGQEAGAGSRRLHTGNPAEPDAGTTTPRKITRRSPGRPADVVPLA